MSDERECGGVVTVSVTACQTTYRPPVKSVENQSRDGMTRLTFPKNANTSNGVVST